MKTTTTITLTNAAGKTEKRTFHSARSLIEYLNNELQRAKIKMASAPDSASLAQSKKSAQRFKKLLALYEKTNKEDKIERRSFRI